MGYGPVINGKQQPISQWVGSWAWQEEQRRQNQWPIGHTPAQATPRQSSRQSPKKS